MEIVGIFRLNLSLVDRKTKAAFGGRMWFDRGASMGRGESAYNAQPDKERRDGRRKQPGIPVVGFRFIEHWWQFRFVEQWQQFRRQQQRDEQKVAVNLFVCARKDLGSFIQRRLY
jgi:hypothetical protein